MASRAPEEDSPEANAALEHLCADYWPPVYAVLRRWGHDKADAEDLCQGFFIHLLRRDRLARPSPDQGRFRHWLLACLRNFVRTDADRWSGPTRRPSGGFVSLEGLAVAESLFQALPQAGGLTRPPTDDPLEGTFDAAFAHRLIELVRRQLRSDYAARDKAALHDALVPYLTEPMEGATTERLAETFGMSSGAVRVALARVKDRFAHLLRAQVRDLVDRPEDVEPELRHLLKAWGG